MNVRARYPDLSQSGALKDRALNALGELEKCRLCPHRCGADRTAGHLGYCRAGMKVRVSSFGPHFGEEPPLVGRHGSGTIFFAWCNMRCVYCQNADVSSFGHGEDHTIEELAVLFLEIQNMGCENLNLVTPTHYTPQILAALDIAARQGLDLPLVWNTGGYESLSALKLLDGVVDIYMPDIKYADDATGMRYSGVTEYPKHAFAALIEMHRQVGDLVIAPGMTASRGLLVRHLVLPGGIADTEKVMRFLVDRISPETYVNIMAQYRPCHKAIAYPALARRIFPEEYLEALALARSAGLQRLASDQRESPESSSH